MRACPDLQSRIMDKSYLLISHHGQSNNILLKTLPDLEQNTLGYDVSQEINCGLFDSMNLCGY